MFKYYLYKLGQFFVNHLPANVSYKFAAVLSDIQYFFSWRDRRSVIKNLKIIIPNVPAKFLPVREVFRNFGKYLVEFFQMGQRIDAEYFKKNITVEGLEKLREAIVRDKGGIVLTAHLGNWELGAAVVSNLGFPIVAVALPHKERPVNDLFNFQRERQGITVLPSNDAVKGCIGALRKKQLVALVGDRDFSSHGEVVNFFGRKTLIPKGAAIFSLKTGCPIIPIFLVRENQSSFRLIIADPIYPRPVNEYPSHPEAVKQILKTYVKVIEDEIRKRPGQWLMFRKFWCDNP